MSEYVSELDLEILLRRAIDNLDEFYLKWKASQRPDSIRPRVDTLSNNLADPFGTPTLPPPPNAVADFIRKATALVKSDDERFALMSLAGAAHVQRLLPEATYERLLREIEEP